MEISVEVRTVVREARNRVTACQTAKETLDIILQVTDLLTSCSDEEYAKPSSAIGIRYATDFKKEFLENHFSHFCEHVLRNIDPKYFDEEKGVSVVLKRLFMEGPADLSFIALVSSILWTNHTKMLHEIVSILDHFTSNGKLVEIFFSQCVSANTQINSSHDLLLLLTTLPDKLANKMKMHLSANFHPNNYYKMLGNELLKSLTRLHQLACSSDDYSITFLSHFVGKVALRGSVDVFLDVLLPQFKKWCYTSPLWSKICSEILVEVPESALEPVLEALLQKIMFYPFFCKLLKDAIHAKTVVHHLITHKFLFVRYYTEANVLQNIIGYLCGDGRRCILIESLKKLLSHWGNSNTTKHSSHSQHLYITQALILAFAQANEEEILEHKQELIHELLLGVQVHLESPNSKIRQLGMVTAECLTLRLHPGSQKLQFEYEENNDIKRLQILAASPKFAAEIEKENFKNKPSIISETMNDGLSSGNPKIQEFNDVKKENFNTNEECGGEDDLQPYEMNEDDHDLIEGIHPPRYISECIDGLLSTDDPKRYIASLRIIKKLIVNDQDNFLHLCVPLVTALLHLQDKYSFEDYCELRFSSMVAATVSCPLPVAGYLTKEFYSPNYNLRQRMDILDVLAAAASELSKPPSKTNVKDPQSPVDVSKVDKEKNWQTIIAERLEKKTRRFGKKTSTVNPKAEANRFAPVAGHFFFPLLQGFDSRQNTFDLLGEDCMVLGCLVCTVGNIMYCARGALVASNMAKCLLEFVWVMHYHNDSHIREALLFALAMAVLSVPGYILVSELQDELSECQNGLEDILSNDPSAECRKLALQVLVSVREVFKKQFNAGQDDV